MENELTEHELTKGEVLEFLRLITEHDKRNSSASYTYIKNTFFKLLIPFPTVAVSKGQLFYRARPHEIGQDFFKEISELSYRPDYFYIEEFGRANEPTQPIFYCSDLGKLAFLETSKISRKNLNIEKEELTIGIWEVQESFNIATIINNEQIQGLNQTMERLNIDFNRIIADFKNAGKENCLAVLDFISKEFTKHSGGDTSNYKITCAFANYVFETKGTKAFSNEEISVDGILFPSVIHRPEGMNLALKPELIDNGKLKLIKAAKIINTKRDEFNYELSEVKSSSIDYENGVINW